MSSLAVRLGRHLRRHTQLPSSSLAASTLKILRWSYSTDYNNGGSEDAKLDVSNEEIEEECNDFLGEKPELKPHGVDPRKGWKYRGVHKAIICGQVGQAPVQKIMKNGRPITVFTVGTGGMFDQRNGAAKDLPKPAQWHRIVVHNEPLGAYAVQQLTKDSSVYIEGDIETRAYNDSISGEAKSTPEICLRRDGKLRLIKSGESVSQISLKI